MIKEWFLGSICYKGHEYKNTGKSIRIKSGHCYECERIRWRLQNSDPVVKKRKLISGKAYYQSNRNNILAGKKVQYKNDENIKLKQYEWKKKNIDKARESQKLFRRRDRLNNAEIYKQKAKEYYRLNSIRISLRNRVYKAIKTYSIKGKILKSNQYGIDFNAIIKKLGPCPGKRYDWHIDHIKPLSLFDFNDIEQIKLAFAPSNHQWLPRNENLIKHNKYDKKKN